MTRRQKYPDTDTFKFFNANPKDRITVDCVERALSTATDIPYNEVVIGLAELQCETGFCDDYDTYLQRKGWVKHKQPRKPDGKKYTGSEFCNELFYMNHDIAVVNIGSHHVVCIKPAECNDGLYRLKVHDIWDSTNGCIGNYWTKE